MTYELHRIHRKDELLLFALINSERIDKLNPVGQLLKASQMSLRIYGFISYMIIQLYGKIR